MRVSFQFICQFAASIFLVHSFCQAQEGHVVFRGKLVDEVTLEPVPGATIRAGDQQTISGVTGDFDIRVNVDEMLFVSHIGYEKMGISATKSEEDRLVIYLTPAVTELAPVSVGVLPSEEDLKQLILQADVPTRYEEAVLRDHLVFALKVKNLGYAYDMNSFDTFLSQLGGNGAVSLISNNPSLGIVGAIRRLRGGRADSSRKPYAGSTHTPSMWDAYRRKEGHYKWLFEHEK